MTQMGIMCYSPRTPGLGGPWCSRQGLRATPAQVPGARLSAPRLRPLGADGSREVGPALHPARARPGRPAHAGPRAAVRPSAAEGAGMRRAAATLRRRERGARGRKENAMPTPGNGTGKGRGCGPRVGSAPITQTGKVRAACSLGGMGAVGCTLPLGGAHPAVNALAPLRSPAAAPAELKPGSECPEARRLRLATRQPRCAPFPNGGRLGVMRGMAARRTGKPKAALPRERCSGSSASSSAPLYRWGN